MTATTPTSSADTRTVATPRRVLMVAYHFPPVAGSSGIQRTLRFVQHLPALGWQPLVLTVHPRAYEAVSNDLLADVPPSTVVERAFALDAARHLSIGGRYLASLALPDRWRTWAWGGVLSGLQMVRRYRPDVIWSTYPIATAHLIGLRLHQRTGIPWIADFRDPMVQENYPTDPRAWKSFDRLERDVAREASRLVFVTPSALATYRERYSDLPAQRFALIENGFDEESFALAETGFERLPLDPQRFTLLHSGIVYPSERDPRALFAVLGRLRREDPELVAGLRLRFRAPGHDDLLHTLAAQTGTADLIDVLPPIPYREALREMLCADGLLVMQGDNCNEQVPAKLYEYLRAGRPLLGLADPVGDTARVMRQAGVRHVGRLEDAAQVENALRTFLADARAGRLAPPTDVPRASMSRHARAETLAALLAQVAAS